MPVTGLAGLSGGPFGVGGPFGSSIISSINTPQIETPMNGGIGLEYTLTITSSAFDPEGSIDTHLSSDWQLATDINFVNIVDSSFNDSSNLTSWQVTGLEADITHYVRVKYKGEAPEKESEWSPTSSFITLASFVQKPSITGPTSSIEINPVTITSSQFVSGGKVTTHVSSDWQLATDSSFNNVIQSTSNDTSNLKSWQVSGLSAGTTYYARVRYTGGPEPLTSDWSDASSFRMMAVPVIQWVTNTPSSWNPTAGQSRNFSISVGDSANPGGSHNTYTYQWYRNGSALSGQTSPTCTFYNPCYYSDNGNSLYCKVTITNAAGSTSGDSNTCSISVTRNVGCDEIQRIENIKFAGSGGKPGGGTSVWGEYKMAQVINGVDYTDICGVAWDIDSFRAKARDGRCPGGYEMTLEFKIDNGHNYSKIEQQRTANGNHCFYGLGTGWMDVQGNQNSLRFQIIFRAGQQYSQCTDGSQIDIQPQMDDDAIGRISIRKRIYRYESRP